MGGGGGGGMIVEPARAGTLIPRDLDDFVAPGPDETNEGSDNMVKIVFVEHGGKRHEVDVKEGWSAMEGAVRAGIRGIIAECGGSASCGTCHVYAEGDAASELPPPNDDEDATLEVVAAGRKPNSRLSCQIEVKPALEGLILQLPEFQE